MIEPGWWQMTASMALYAALVGMGAQSSFPRNWILIATVEVGPLRYHQLRLFLQEQVKIFIKISLLGWRDGSEVKQCLLPSKRPKHPWSLWVPTHSSLLAIHSPPPPLFHTHTMK